MVLRKITGARIQDAIMIIQIRNVARRNFVQHIQHNIFVWGIMERGNLKLKKEKCKNGHTFNNLNITDNSKYHIQAS